MTAQIADLERVVETMRHLGVHDLALPCGLRVQLEPIAAVNVLNREQPAVKPLSERDARAAMYRRAGLQIPMDK